MTFCLSEGALLVIIAANSRGRPWVVTSFKLAQKPVPDTFIGRKTQEPFARNGTHRSLARLQQVAARESVRPPPGTSHPLLFTLSDRALDLGGEHAQVTSQPGE